MRRPYVLEIELSAQAEQPRSQHARRRRPCGTERRAVGEVVVRVQRVDDVEVEVGPRPSESEDLADAEIELIDAITELRVRLQDVDCDSAGGRPDECTPERRTRGIEH